MLIHLYSNLRSFFMVAALQRYSGACTEVDVCQNEEVLQQIKFQY